MKRARKPDLRRCRTIWKWNNAACFSRMTIVKLKPELPQHASECHAASAAPGYVDDGLSHGATLVVDIEDGRFVFFYLPVDL